MCWIILILLVVSCGNNSTNEQTATSSITDEPFTIEDSFIGAKLSTENIISNIQLNFDINFKNIPKTPTNITVTNKKLYSIQKFKEDRLYSDFKNQLYNKRNDVELTPNSLKEFLKSGVRLDDPRVTNNYQYNALVTLMESDYNRKNKLVSIAMYNIDNINFGSKSPLCTSLAIQHFDIYKKLVKKGADVNFKSEHNYSPIQFASQYSATNIVEFLLKQGVTPNNAIPYVRNLGILKVLLENGLDINHQDSEGRTILSEALKNTNENFTSELLDTYQADLSVISYDNFNEYELEIMSENSYIKSILKKIQKQPSYIFYMISNNQLTNLQAKIDSLPNINITNKNGYSILSMLVQNTNNVLPFIKLVVSKNIDLNHQSSFGWTPFHLAVKNNNIEVVEYFLTLNNINASLTNNHGQSPLDTATIYNYTNMIQLLEQHR